MSRYSSGSVKYCKNITLKLSQARKEHWLWKDHFAERCRILSSNGATEFRELIKYMREVERTLCVCVRQIILWYLIICFANHLFTYFQIFHTLCFVKKLTSHTGKFIMAVKLKEAIRSGDLRHLFSFSDSRYYGCLECIFYQCNKHAFAKCLLCAAHSEVTIHFWKLLGWPKRSFGFFHNIVWMFPSMLQKW